MEASAMKHNPKVVHFNAQNLADLFALKTVDLPQSESAGCAFW
jgi:hypothetical protein